MIIIANRWFIRIIVSMGDTLAAFCSAILSDLEGRWMGPVLCSLVTYHRSPVMAVHTALRMTAVVVGWVLVVGAFDGSVDLVVAGQGWEAPAGRLAGWP